MPEEIININTLPEIAHTEIAEADYSWIIDNDSAAPQSRRVTVAEQDLYLKSVGFQNTQTIVINQSNAATILGGTLVSDRAYFIDGIIDLTGLGVSFNVPTGGLNIIGVTFDISQIICSDDNYEMFLSAGGGNVLCSNLGITTSGTGSSVFAMTSNTGFEAVELNYINFNGCTSLGYLDNYRQYLEFGTGRFGGTPELEFRNAMNGARISTSIVRNINDITSLFKAGTGFTMSGRFITDINADLPTVGALIDFDDTHITNDESLLLKGCFITRDGVLNSMDALICPNITERNVKSLWSGNTGLPDTTKYIKGIITTEVTTTINSIDTYEVLLGTFTVDNPSHFDMPSNGQFRLLSGSGTYRFSGNLSIESSANNVLDLRVTKSTDGGATFPTEINHVQRTVNSFQGQRDVAIFTIEFISDLVKDERFRIEVENKTSTANVTAELDDSFIISRV